MIHHTDGASRRVARVVAAVGAPLLAIIAGGLSNPASAGSGIALGAQPQLRGSYCDESDRDLAPSRAGCARINGYIAAGERFGSDERIGGRRSPFGPIDEPGIVGGRCVRRHDHRRTLRRRALVAVGEPRRHSALTPKRRHRNLWTCLARRLLASLKRRLVKRRLDRATPRALVTFDPMPRRLTAASRNRLQRTEVDRFVLALGVEPRAPLKAAVGDRQHVEGDRPHFAPARSRRRARAPARRRAAFADPRRSSLRSAPQPNEARPDRSRGRPSTPRERRCAPAGRRRRRAFRDSA